MKDVEPGSVQSRMQWMLAAAWDICLHRIASGRIRINKESSLQLHYAFILAQMGELACVGQDEKFTIELETHHAGKNIDIWCALRDCEAAIELKCFRKASNRATDTDMYDVLKDLSRLESYSHVAFRRFICLTDNGYYASAAHKGHAGSVSIADGKTYPQTVPIIPSWAGRWTDSARDTQIVLKRNLQFAWQHIGGWYFLYMEI